jgi:hypothetical protein
MNGARRAMRALGRAGRNLAAGVGEWMYWQRRATTLFLSPDRYVANPNKPPENYQEFLIRTAGPLLREPSALARIAGRPVG